MANEQIRQRIQVDMGASGNLPRTLGEARDRARETSRHVREAREQFSRFGSAREMAARRFGAQASDWNFNNPDARARREEAYGRLTKTAAAGFAAGSGAIIGTASLFSPAAAERFQWALKDFAASIGRDLLPGLEAATRGVRSVANAYLSLSPGTRRFISETIMWGTAVAGGILVIRGIVAVARMAWGGVTALTGAVGALGTSATAVAARLGLVTGTMTAGAAAGAGLFGFLARNAKMLGAIGVGAAVGFSDIETARNGSGFDKVAFGLKFLIRNTLGELVPGYSVSKDNREDFLRDWLAQGKGSKADRDRWEKELQGGGAGKAGKDDSFGMAARPAQVLPDALAYLQQLQVDVAGLRADPMKEAADKLDLAAEKMQQAADSMLAGAGGGAAGMTEFGMASAMFQAAAIAARTGADTLAGAVGGTGRAG